MNTLPAPHPEERITDVVTIVVAATEPARTYLCENCYRETEGPAGLSPAREDAAAKRIRRAAALVSPR